MGVRLRRGECGRGVSSQGLGGVVGAGFVRDEGEVAWGGFVG